MIERLDDQFFARAFVAVQYLLGARDTELGDALRVTPPLAGELRHPSRERRARALGAELLEVARALELRRLE